MRVGINKCGWGKNKCGWGKNKCGWVKMGVGGHKQVQVGINEDRHCCKV